MCLSVDKKETQKIKKLKTQKMIVWKILDKSDNFYHTPFRYYPVKRGTWLKAQLLLHYPTTDYSVINYGAIHCYRTRAAARNKSIGEDNWIVVKCKALKRDFIAAGEDQDLAFKKIYIPKPGEKI